ncbi:MAG: helix-turn-helix domain-containing protein [Candidatus Merdivicinus sp.]|jgi:YesN/AraC family two-component response regulator
MKKLFLQSKRNMRMLLFSILFSISFVVLLFFQGQVIRKEQLRYQEQAAYDTSKTFLYFSSDFTNMINSANTIYQSLWYRHLRTPANIYQEEFHAIRKSEISQELKSKTISMKFVSNILVITPDYVITKDGWFDHEQYEFYYNTKLNYQNGDIQVESNRSDFFTCIIKEPYSRINPGVICMLLDRTQFTNLLDRILPDNTAYCMVKFGDNIIYEKGEKKQDLVIASQYLASPSVTLEIGKPSYLLQNISRILRNLLLYSIIDIIACAAVSLLLSHITIKPLTKLIHQIGGNSTEDPYDQLEVFIKTSSLSNHELNQKTDELRLCIQKIVSYTQKEVFLNMLTDKEFDFRDELASLYIPWIHEGYFFFFILLESNSENLPHRLKKAEQAAKYALFFPIWQNQCCLFLWFEKIEEAQKSLQELTNDYAQTNTEMVRFICSDIMFDPEMIYDNYHIVQEEFEKLWETSDELPLTLQLKLIQLFYHGNLTKLFEIAQMDWESNQSAYFVFLSKLTREISGKSDSDIPATLQNWDYFCKQIQQLEQENITAQKRNRDISGQLICEYIQQHFCEEDMCVKKLADIFSIHRTIISKMIKNFTGKNFSDYLLELRIQESIRLMKASDLPITAISEKIGYANYITFKRAFQRAKGITPKEYRDNKINQNFPIPESHIP